MCSILKIEKCILITQFADVFIFWLRILQNERPIEVNRVLLSMFSNLNETFTNNDWKERSSYLILYEYIEVFPPHERWKDNRIWVWFPELRNVSTCSLQLEMGICI